MKTIKTTRNRINRKRNHRITALVAALFVMLFLSNCGDAENEYTSLTCYFVFDNSVHQDATLATSMNNNAPGIFCYATKSMKSGATYFDFSNNQGASSSAIANAIDQRRTMILGQNNGIIIGFGNADYPSTFYVYDAECPNCFDPNALPVRSHRLSMSSDGIATCKTCSRKYNLNAGGYISEGEQGNKLTRYRASTTGPFGVLNVN